MGDESDGGRRKVCITSHVDVCSEGAMKLSDVMKFARYTTPDRKGRVGVPASVFCCHEYIEGDTKVSRSATSRGSR